MDVTPPTDNLYKFMAVGGIVMVVACFIFPLLWFRESGMEYLAQLRATNELKVHEDFARERRRTLDLRKQSAINEKNEFQKRLNSASNSAAVEKLEGQIKETNRAIESIEDSSQELNLNLALKKAQIENEETVSINRRRDSRLAVWLGVGLALFGAVLSFFGFLGWYNRLQKYQDRLTKKEAEEKLGTPTEADEKIEQEQLNQRNVDVPQPTQ